MSDRTLAWLGRSVAIVTLVLGVITAVILLTSVPSDLLTSGQVQSLSGTVLVPVIVLIVLPQVPRNGSIWAFAITGAALALAILGDSVALSMSGLSSADITDSMRPGADPILLAPADLPVGASVGLMLSLTLWIPSFVLIPTMVLLLFPDGHYPRRQRWWRWIGILTITTIGVGIPSLMWDFRPSSTVGYTKIQGGGSGEITAPIGAIAGMVVVLLVIASIIGYIVKWRQSEGEQRVQFRWVGFVFLLFAVWQVVTIALGGLEELDPTIPDTISWLMIAAIPISYAVAITKYRLYDIDLVVSRTLVYGLLLALIAIVYVAIVVGPLLILGEPDGADSQPAPILAILATALIAIAFQPVRRRLERLANRVVYGKRATPYEVLSDFTRRVAATDEELLQQVPESLVTGTGAESAAVWIRQGTAWALSTAYPDDTAVEPFPGFDESANGQVSVPVEHNGEIMGAVTLRAPRSQRLSPDDERLARQVASGMGLALRNQRLTEHLRTRVEALRESRRRIVEVQDDTRRSLERDLHDGAQQQLVALKVKLGIASQFAERDGAETTASTVASLTEDADRAVDDMRAFARGIYPPLLEAEGLLAAITAHTRRLPFPVDVTGTDLGRYDRQVESTVYFCFVEGVPGASVPPDQLRTVVDLAERNGTLHVSITNEAPAGTDRIPEPVRISMSDRVDVLGGVMDVAHVNETTTVISLDLPLASVGAQP